MLLLEFPHISSTPIAVFVSKDGKYNRPILSFMTDLRTEDMGTQTAQRERRLMNFIARLPDIAAAKQIGKYIVTTFGSSQVVDENKAQQLLATRQYFELPSSPHSEFWSLTGRPWWEYVECFDEYDGPIKAPLNVRNPNITVDNIDEKIDEFEENHGKIEVLSPQTISRMQSGAVRESYLRKLARIKILR
jgi:hypothetical protein